MTEKADVVVRDLTENVFTFGLYDLKVRWAESTTLVVSLAGIGDVRRGETHFEWGETLARLPVRPHAILVRDRAQSWYNARDGRDEMTAFIRDYAARHGINRIVTLGLSMGAAGALELGAALEADHVLAVNPRILLGLGAAPWDTRNRERIADAEPFAVRDMSTRLRPGTAYTLVGAVDCLNDIAHLASVHDRLDETGGQSLNVRLCGYRGDHNIGIALQTRERIVATMARLLNEDDTLPEDFFELDAELCRLARRQLDAPGARDTRNAIVAYGLKHPRRTPVQWLRIIEAHQALHYEATAQDYPALVAQSHALVHTAQAIVGPELTRYAVHGWYPHEEWGGMWSRARAHFIRFNLFDFDPEDTVECRLRLRVFLSAAGPRQIVRVTTGDGFETTLDLNHASDAPRIFDLAVPCRSARMDIKIDTPDPISPAQAGLNGDQREISVGLLAMRFVRRRSEAQERPAPVVRATG